MDENIKIAECHVWLGSWWVTMDGCYETRPGVIQMEEGFQGILEVSYLGGDRGSRWVGDACLSLPDAKSVARSSENAWHREYEKEPSRMISG